jgi:hypothetical protein
MQVSATGDTDHLTLTVGSVRATLSKGDLWWSLKGEGLGEGVESTLADGRLPWPQALHMALFEMALVASNRGTLVPDTRVIRVTLNEAWKANPPEGVDVMRVGQNPETPYVDYTNGSRFIGLCPHCKKPVTPDQDVMMRGDKPFGDNATCQEHGRVGMLFLGFF